MKELNIEDKGHKMVTGEVEEMNLKPLSSPLITQKYTQLFYESNHKSGVPHTFLVTTSTQGLPEGSEPKTLGYVHFQDGPIKEAGVNGVCGEDLIAMVIKRLEGFQSGQFNCKENEMAKDKLEEALMWLRKRTTAREMRNVEGTHEV